MLLTKTRLSGKQDFHLKKKTKCYSEMGLYSFKQHMLNAITKDLVKGENSDAKVQSTECFLPGC